MPKTLRFAVPTPQTVSRSVSGEEETELKNTEYTHAREYLEVGLPNVAAFSEFVLRNIKTLYS